MATATIKAVWRAGNYVHIAVEVAEAASTEFYRAKVPLSDMTGKTNAERREILRLAIKEIRDEKISSELPDATITGTVDI